jgi:hypothetical protein
MPKEAWHSEEGGTRLPATNMRMLPWAMSSVWNFPAASPLDARGFLAPDVALRGPLPDHVQGAGPPSLTKKPQTIDSQQTMDLVARGQAWSLVGALASNGICELF